MATRAITSITTPRVKASIRSLTDLPRMNCTQANIPKPETRARQSQPYFCQPSGPPTDLIKERRKRISPAVPHKPPTIDDMQGGARSGAAAAAG